MAFQDDISPSYIGENRITVTLGQPGVVPRAFQLLEILVDYSKCDPEGVMLPLELTLTGPRGNIVDRRYWRKRPLTSTTIRAQEGGQHLVRVAEVAHDRWWGALLINVVGERLQDR